MSTLDYARERVNALLDEVERLTEVEFPHEHSERALEQLRDRFQDNLKRLAQFDLKSDLAIVQQTCRLVLVDLYQYLPLLGFVLRSTNVRNAFEVFGPLLRLAGDILEPGVSAGPRKTKLLLSSEWDFSPFTFPAIPALPDFLFIDLPAPESSNPLLLPLAGHELGHAVWIKRRLRTQVQSRAKQSTLDAIKRRWTDYQSVFSQPTLTPAELTTDLSALHSLSPAVDWCVKQAEETFGDFLGLRLFRESYLHSFSYLLSPGMGARSVWYPSIKSRVQNLVTAASSFQVTCPPDYTEFFGTDSPSSLASADQFRLSVADEALQSLIDDLIVLANTEVENASIKEGSETEVRRILRHFKRVTPTENCVNIADILNAAWRANHDEEFWQDLPFIRDKADLVLKELTLKNLEVFEIEQLLS